MVELVDGAGTGLQTRDVDLERAVEGLARRERLVVDLHYFVGLDVATVAEVVHSAPGTVEATLRQARERLRQLVGTTMDDLMDQRLSAAARRWQDEQPPPPEVPLERLDESLRRGSPGAGSLAVAAVVLLVGGGAVARRGRAEPRRPPRIRALPTRHPHRTRRRPPCEERRPVPRPGAGASGGSATACGSTPFDDVSATGHISGTVHPGDTLAFDVVLEAPGVVSLHPCPDYTITFGALTTTRQLNCAQVPYLASLVRSSGKVTGVPTGAAGRDAGRSSGCA